MGKLVQSINTFKRRFIQTPLLEWRTLNSAQKSVDAALMLGLGALLVWFFAQGGPIYRWDWGQLKEFLVRVKAGEGPHFWDGVSPGLLTRGLLTTLQVSFWSFLLAGVLGLCFGLARSLKRPLGRMLGGTYVGLARNVPPLVLVFIVHFFITAQLGRNVPWGAFSAVPILSWLLPPAGQMPVFTSAVLALGLYEGAYMTEIVRGGIASVPKGQWEAAASLGFGRFKRIVHVILPQARRMMLPPLTSQAVSLVKDSAIVSVISVRELTFQGQELMASSYLVFEIWITVTVMYLLLCLTLSAMGGRMEKNIRWRH